MPGLFDDYEVATQAGQVAFTSSDRGLAVAWADKHCSALGPLSVYRVLWFRDTFYRTASGEEGVA
jgi:hypothetical protein